MTATDSSRPLPSTPLPQPGVLPPPKRTSSSRVIVAESTTPTNWKVSLAVSFIFAVVLIAVAASIATGHLSLPGWASDWGIKALWGISGTLLGCQAIFGLFMILNHFNEKKARAQIALLNQDIEDLDSDSEVEDGAGGHSSRVDSDSESDDGIGTTPLPSRRKEKEKEKETDGAGPSQPPVRTNPISPISIKEADFYERINTVPLEHVPRNIAVGRGEKKTNVTHAYCNLEDPAQPVAKQCKNQPCSQIPFFGTTEEFNGDSALMSVRLPPSQIWAFDDQITGLFHDKKLRHGKTLLDEAECYFFVFNNTQEAKGNVRNIYMQMMAMPNFPEKSQGVSSITNKDGSQATLETILCNTQGINKAFAGENRVPIGEKFPKPRLTKMYKGEFRPHLTSDCQICIQRGAPISTFEMGAVCGGRAIAIKAVVLNDAESKEGQDLINAMKAGTTGGFLDSLHQDHFPQYSSIARVFSHPNDLADADASD